MRAVWARKTEISWQKTHIIRDDGVDDALFAQQRRLCFRLSWSDTIFDAEGLSEFDESILHRVRSSRNILGADYHIGSQPAGGKGTLSRLNLGRCLPSKTMRGAIPASSRVTRR